ncbi:MAG: 7-cyano-7-deazaguanine synthase QueC [Planctomycetes bacterium]|nr:7-cyano-7-deazaguanine synthase QueC [Planctomycetota bacterium]
MKECVILLSGGLDSAVSAVIARKRFASGLCLFIDYGQKAVLPEKQAVRKISAFLEMPLKIVKLPFLAKMTRTALVNRTEQIPELTMSLLGRHSTLEKSVRAVWVPNRNGLFINIAAAYAETLGYGHIITGFNKEEAVTFPDNSAPFVKAINKSLSYSTLSKAEVLSFTQNLSKDEIVRLAIKTGAPLELIWSCYGSGKRHCMKCESCMRLKRALARNDKWEWFRKHRGI